MNKDTTKLEQKTTRGENQKLHKRFIMSSDLLLTAQMDCKFWEVERWRRWRTGKGIPHLKSNINRKAPRDKEKLTASPRDEGKVPKLDLKR